MASMYEAITFGDEADVDRGRDTILDPAGDPLSL
jgi:hypothetical protein